MTSTPSALRSQQIFCGGRTCRSLSAARRIKHCWMHETTADMLYTFLCRVESTDVPFLQRISRITSNYIKAGCSIDEIPVGDFFAPSQLDFTHGSYWCSGSGSYHALIPAAAEAWGLPVSGCTASEPQRITDALSSGKLVVAIMSAGHFTSSGHFIVLRGVQDEKILVADPASRTRSEQSWDLSIILNEASKAAGSGGPFWIIG